MLLALAAGRSRPHHAVEVLQYEMEKALKRGDAEMTSHADTRALEPCPHCGGSEFEISRNRVAYCSTARCFGGQCGVDLDDPADIAAWNHRAYGLPVAWRYFDEGSWAYDEEPHTGWEPLAPVKQP